ncbi:class A beta-lactamase-related serine hydrolase [Actinoallomurus purpureus]|uniref:serine hydrolase n=1 Tax=Actinoallomurus purpureus TaxID=478114 RepID=UPI002093575F|nr:serine hydrolase [Actinoallomurus purpureus]MCO6009042.1 class A beta-lactamase-related serine hydrolase [Actinoallomurus purpureus]
MWCRPRTAVHVELNGSNRKPQRGNSARSPASHTPGSIPYGSPKRPRVWPVGCSSCRRTCRSATTRRPTCCCAGSGRTAGGGVGPGQVFWTRLPTGFPPEVRVPAKTGTLPGLYIEVGVAEYPDGGRYAIAIFAESERSSRDTRCPRPRGYCRRRRVDH